MTRARGIRRDGIKLKQDEADLELTIAKRQAELAKKRAEIVAWHYARAKIQQEADSKGFRITVSHCMIDRLIDRLNDWLITNHS